MVRAHTCVYLCTRVCAHVEEWSYSTHTHAHVFVHTCVCARRGADLKDCLQFLHLYPVNFPHVIKHSSVSLEWHTVP